MQEPILTDSTQILLKTEEHFKRALPVVSSAHSLIAKKMDSPNSKIDDKVIDGLLTNLCPLYHRIALYLQVAQLFSTEQLLPEEKAKLASYIQDSQGKLTIICLTLLQLTYIRTEGLLDLLMKSQVKDKKRDYLQRAYDFTGQAEWFYGVNPPAIDDLNPTIAHEMAIQKRVIENLANTVRPFTLKPWLPDDTFLAMQPPNAYSVLREDLSVLIDSPKAPSKPQLKKKKKAKKRKTCLVEKESVSGAPMPGSVKAGLIANNLGQSIEDKKDGNLLNKAALCYSSLKTFTKVTLFFASPASNNAVQKLYQQTGHELKTNAAGKIKLVRSLSYPSFFDETAKEIDKQLQHDFEDYQTTYLSKVTK